MCYIENDRPTVKNINRYVTWKYADDWQEIGSELDLHDDILNHTYSHVDRNNKKKFHYMITSWIEGGVNATWRTLEVALTNVNRRKLGLYPVDDVYGMITHLLYVRMQGPPL